MSPFDTVHKTSYSPFIEIVCPNCTVLEIRPDICRKLQIFPTPHVFGALFGVDPIAILSRSLACEN